MSPALLGQSSKVASEQVAGMLGELQQKPMRTGDLNAAIKLKRQNDKMLRLQRRKKSVRSGLSQVHCRCFRGDPAEDSQFHAFKAACASCPRPLRMLRGRSSCSYSQIIIRLCQSMPHRKHRSSSSNTMEVHVKLPFTKRRST